MPLKIKLLKVGQTYLDYAIGNWAIPACMQTSGAGTGICDLYILQSLTSRLWHRSRLAFQKKTVEEVVSHRRQHGEDNPFLGWQRKWIYAYLAEGVEIFNTRTGERNGVWHNGPILTSWVHAATYRWGGHIIPSINRFPSRAIILGRGQ